MGQLRIYADSIPYDGMHGLHLEPCSASSVLSSSALGPASASTQKTSLQVMPNLMLTNGPAKMSDPMPVSTAVCMERVFHVEHVKAVTTC